MGFDLASGFGAVILRRMRHLSTTLRSLRSAIALATACYIIGFAVIGLLATAFITRNTPDVFAGGMMPSADATGAAACTLMGLDPESRWDRKRLEVHEALRLSRLAWAENVSEAVGFRGVLRAGSEIVKVAFPKTATWLRDRLDPSDKVRPPPEWSPTLNAAVQRAVLAGPAEDPSVYSYMGQPLVPLMSLIRGDVSRASIILFHPTSEESVRATFGVPNHVPLELLMEVTPSGTAIEVRQFTWSADCSDGRVARSTIRWRGDGVRAGSTASMQVATPEVWSIVDAQREDMMRHLREMESMKSPE